jgi:predicted dehydrogenase
MGLRHARVLAGLPDRFEVVGAYDVRADPPPAGLARIGGEAEAIARAEVVLVATPIAAHTGTVGRALAAGRHVLVEKPLCASSAEAAGLVARSGASRLFVGHSERFNPVVRALARLVRDDAPLALDLTRVGPSRPSDCGVLLNLGVHDFDLAAYLGGGDLRLRAAHGAAAGGAEDLAHVLFCTGNGAVGHLYVDRTIPARRRTLTVTTSRFVYEGDLLRHRLVRTHRSGGSATDVPLVLEEPLAAQALALADALDGAANREIATGADGARAVLLAERAAADCTEKLSLFAGA